MPEKMDFPERTLSQMCIRDRFCHHPVVSHYRTNLVKVAVVLEQEDIRRLALFIRQEVGRHLAVVWFQPVSYTHLDVYKRQTGGRYPRSPVRGFFYVSAILRNDK